MTDTTQGGPSGASQMLPSLANVRRMSYAELEHLSNLGDAWATAELVGRDKQRAKLRASVEARRGKNGSWVIPQEGPALRDWEAKQVAASLGVEVPDWWPKEAVEANSKARKRAERGVTALKWQEVRDAVTGAIGNALEERQEKAQEKEPALFAKPERCGVPPGYYIDGFGNFTNGATGVAERPATDAELRGAGLEPGNFPLPGERMQQILRAREASGQPLVPPLPMLPAPKPTPSLLDAHKAKLKAQQDNARDKASISAKEIVAEVCKHVPPEGLDENGKPKTWPRPPEGWNMWVDYVREKKRGTPPGWASWDEYERARARAAAFRDAHTFPKLKAVDKPKPELEEPAGVIFEPEIAPNGVVVIHPALAPQRDYKLTVTPRSNRLAGNLAPRGFEYLETSASWTMLVHIASGALWDFHVGKGLVRAGMLTSRGTVEAVKPQKGKADMGREKEDDENDALAEAIIEAQLKAAGIPVDNTPWRGDSSLYKSKSIPQKSAECHKSPSLVYDLGALRIWGSRGSAHDKAGAPNWALRLICLESLGKYDTPEPVVELNERARGLGFAPVSVPGPAWVHIHWPDYGTPGLTAAWWQRFASQLRGIEGDVVVYCYGGHGRTGTALSILGCLLDAIPLNQCPVAWLRRNYCSCVVESDAQCDYIERITGREVNSGPRDYTGYSYTSRGPSKYVEGYKDPVTAEKELAAVHGHSKGQRKGKRRRNKKRRVAKLKQPGMRWA